MLISTLLSFAFFRLLDSTIVTLNIKLFSFPVFVSEKGFRTTFLFLFILFVMLTYVFFGLFLASNQDIIVLASPMLFFIFLFRSLFSVFRSHLVSIEKNYTVSILDLLNNGARMLFLALIVYVTNDIYNAFLFMLLWQIFCLFIIGFVSKLSLSGTCLKQFKMLLILCSQKRWIIFSIFINAAASMTVLAGDRAILLFQGDRLDLAANGYLVTAYFGCLALYAPFGRYFIPKLINTHSFRSIFFKAFFILACFFTALNLTLLYFYSPILDVWVPDSEVRERVSNKLSLVIYLASAGAVGALSYTIQLRLADFRINYISMFAYVIIFTALYFFSDISFATWITVKWILFSSHLVLVLLLAWRKNLV